MSSPASSFTLTHTTLAAAQKFPLPFAPRENRMARSTIGLEGVGDAGKSARKPEAHHRAGAGDVLVQQHAQRPAARRVGPAAAPGLRRLWPSLRHLWRARQAALPRALAL